MVVYYSPEFSKYVRNDFHKDLKAVVPHLPDHGQATLPAHQLRVILSAV